MVYILVEIGIYSYYHRYLSSIIASDDTSQSPPEDTKLVPLNYQIRSVSHSHIPPYNNNRLINVSLKHEHNNPILAISLPDAKDNSCSRETGVHVVGDPAITVLLPWKSVDLRRLPLTRKQRLEEGELINERRRIFHEEIGTRNRIYQKYA